MPRQQRSRKLVHPSFQLRLIGVFIALGCLGALFQVLLMARTIAEVSAQAQAQQPVDVTGLLLQNIVLTLALLVPLMWVVGVVVTHRIAGPVYRFEKHLEDVAEGRTLADCSIRKGDEFQTLCERINVAVRSLRAARDSDESSRRAA